MPMRFGFVLAMGALLLMPCQRTAAHPADEFAQVTLRIDIDDDAVELAVKIPVKAATLTVFDGLSPVAMDQMEPAAFAALIAPVFAERCPLTIDGLVVSPTIVEPVVAMENSRLPARRFPEAQVLEQGTLKFIARYETKGPPRRVSLDWSIFANQYDEAGQPIHEDELIMVAALVSAEGQEQFSFFTPMEPRFTWHAAYGTALPADFLASKPMRSKFLYVPVLSIVLMLAGVVGAVSAFKRTTKPRAGAIFVAACVVAVTVLPFGRYRFEHTPSPVVLDDDHALAVFESLHRNIYRAFDYTDEGAVYDALAQSVDGPMLETIYNDVYQSLIMREQNGAVSKVVRVEIDQAEVLPIDEAIEEAYGPAVYGVACTWQVDGLVTHFGHTHARTNAFNATYTIAPREGGWRIVDAEILQQRRIDDGSQTAKDLFDQTDEADEP